MRFGVVGHSALAQEAVALWSSLGHEVLAAGWPEGAGDGAVERMPSVGALLDSLEPLRRVFVFGDDEVLAESYILALAARLDVSDVVVDAAISSPEGPARRMAMLSQPRARYVGFGLLSQDGGLRQATILGGGHKVGFDLVATLLEDLVGKGQCWYVGAGGAGQILSKLLAAFAWVERAALAEYASLLVNGCGVGAAEVALAVRGWGVQAGETPSLEAVARELECGGPRVDLAVKGASVEEQAASLLMSSGVASWMVFAAFYGRFSGGSSAKEREVHKSRYPRPANAELPAIGVLLEDCRASFLALRVIATVEFAEILGPVSDAWSLQASVVDCLRLLRGAHLTRSPMYEPFVTAAADPHGLSLLAYPRVQFMLSPLVPALRRVCQLAVATGVSMPVVAACLQHFDGKTSPWAGLRLGGA